MVKVPQSVVVAAPSNKPIEIVDLEYHHCRFIVGSSAHTGLALYCGAPKKEGSYCSYHAQQCYNYQPPSSRRASA